MKCIALIVDGRREIAAVATANVEWHNAMTFSFHSVDDYNLLDTEVELVQVAILWALWKIKNIFNKHQPEFDDGYNY